MVSASHSCRPSRFVNARAHQQTNITGVLQTWKALRAPETGGAGVAEFTRPRQRRALPEERCWCAATPAHRLTAAETPCPKPPCGSRPPTRSRSPTSPAAHRCTRPSIAAEQEALVRTVFTDRNEDLRIGLHTCKESDKSESHWPEFHQNHGNPTTEAYAHLLLRGVCQLLLVPRKPPPLRRIRHNRGRGTIHAPAP